jgi:integrase
MKGVSQKDGRWIASWVYGGKQYQRRYRTEASAAWARREALASLDLGNDPREKLDPRRSAVTVLDVLDFYAKREPAPKSDRHSQHRAAFAKTALGSKAAEAFALADMEGFITARRGYAGAETCSKDFRHLKAACAYAKAKGKISKHYFENLAGDKVTRRRLMPPSGEVGKPIPPEHLEAILARLHKDARRAVLFARSTGCRKGEVAALDWQKHLKPEGFVPIVQKKSRKRFVAYDPAIVGPRGIGLVFSELGTTKEAIEERVTACWRYAVKAAKVGHYRFHDLRHSYGTDLTDAGRTYDDVGAIMGISGEMAKVYGHRDDAKLQLAEIAKSMAAAREKIG